MRKLTSGVPRGHTDARTKDARAYRSAVLALQRRFSSLPLEAQHWLQEAAFLQLDLRRLGVSLVAATGRRQRREASRIRRQQMAARGALARIEDRLERLALSDHTPETAAAWAARRNQGASA